MRAVLGGVFALTVVLGLVIHAPARLVLDSLGTIGVQAGLVQGTVWHATAQRVRLGALTVSEIEARMQATGLLSGAGVFDVRVNDPSVQVEGRVTARSGGLVLEALEGVVQLSAVPELAALPIPSDSGVFLDGITVHLDAEGACVSAEGSAMTSLVSDLGDRYGVELPLLDLQAYCAGADIGFNLSGRSQALTLDGFISLNRQSPRYRVQAQTSVAEVISVLVALGFEADGNVWVAESAY